MNAAKYIILPLVLMCLEARAATVAVDTNISLLTPGVLGDHELTVQQDPIDDNPTSIWFDRDVLTKLRFVAANADEGSDWYLASLGDSFSKETIESGNFVTFVASSVHNVIDVGFSEFYLGVNTGQGEVVGNVIPRDVFGWAKFGNSPSGLEFTDVTILNPEMELDPPPVFGPKTVARWECVSDSRTPFCTGGEPSVNLKSHNDSSFGFQVWGYGPSGFFDDEHFLAGISAVTKGLDPFYDPTLDAWLFASVQFDVVGTGDTDLFLQIGRNGISGKDLHSSMINVVFGGGDDPALNGDSQRETNSLTPDGSISVVEDFVARLVTGSPVSLSQMVDTSESPYNLTFDYQFRSTTGVLDVLLDGMSVGTIAAPTSRASEFTTASLRVDGELLNRTDVDLEFVLDGPARSSVLLNNVAFPGVVNGGFQTEGLAGWTITTSPSGAVEALGLSTIPEPSGTLLASAGLICTWLGGRRRSTT